MFRAIKSVINKIAKKTLVKNALWDLLAKIVSLAIQAVYFALITRALGTEGYGLFIGITSMAALVFPFANFGSGDILIQESSRNKRLFANYWGNGLIIIFAASVILIAIVWAIAPLLLEEGANNLAILAILITDLLGLSLFDFSAKAFMSINLIKNSSVLQTLNAFNKLIAALILYFSFKQPVLLNWAYLYLAAAVVTSAISIFWVSKTIDKPKPRLNKIKFGMQRGVHFAIGESASKINSHIDKTMLASMATLEATGIYGAAYRFIDIACVPFYAILVVSYPKFFQHGVSGIRGCLPLLKRLLPVISIYGVVIGCGCWLLAPLVPIILGAEYQEAIYTLKWLAPIPLISGLQLLLADTLTGAGFQTIRSKIQVTTAVGNGLLNLWLIPQFSWLGAAWATLASDSFRVVGLLLAVIFLYRRSVSQ
ncbi:oligosaccharide flippase family protein [Myxosarcina sp. GI1]|uniref:oligosaccharide flippase family protein n=1 Tax=Myxosarcina sp. GI1 TaxID=1541065 RepID=UPI00056803D9|nr:oligosaccharide flippase family protein [Myxosarcina sp. GI1]